MNIDTKLKSVNDAPLIPFEGIINTLNSVTRQIYYRPLVVSSALTLTTSNNAFTIGLAQGAGTVSSINDLVGDISFTNGMDTSVSVGTDITINVLSTDLATINTIPKRNANGTFNVSNPTTPGNVANKEYVDSVAQSLRPQIPVDVLRVATFGNIAAAAGVGVDVITTGIGIGKTLSNSGATNTTGGFVALSIDSVLMTVGSRILITGDGLHNGIYVVSVVGDNVSVNWVITRTSDFDETSEVLSGSYVYIKSGTVYSSSGWVLTTSNPISIDVDVQTWIQFNSAGQVIGSNVGTGGVGLYKQKVGQSLQFYNINGGSSKIIVYTDPSNNEIDIDVNESDLNLNSMVGPLYPLRGGTGLSSYATGNFLVSNGLSPFTNDKVAPVGVVVGTTDTQTMTNKTIIGGTNTISASHLRSASADISINTTTPGVGYTLVTTSPTTATWQIPFSVSGITTSTQTYYGFSSSSLVNSYSIALGTSANTTGTYSIALGHNTSATANYSIALGGNSSSNHNNSVMIGTGTTDTIGQMKLSSTITTIKATGLQNVGTGQVVCQSSTGTVGPNTNGAMIIPITATDPTAVLGGVYYSSVSNKIKISNGTTWNEVATTSKEIITNLSAGTSILRSFTDTSSTGANWRYVLRSPSVGYRAGDIMATWQPATTNVSYTERSTSDIGDTSAFAISVVHSAGTIALRVIITGADIWSITFYEDLF
jgi:Head domain of trimeric autotransporter adhesin